MSIGLDTGYRAGGGTTAMAATGMGIAILDLLFGVNRREGNGGGILSPLVGGGGISHHAEQQDIAIARLQDEVRHEKEVSGLKLKLAEQQSLFAHASLGKDVRQLQSFFTIAPAVSTTPVSLAVPGTPAIIPEPVPSAT